MDAGVLAGARTLRSGQAEANGVSGATGASVDVFFGVNEEGESTVSMNALRPMQTSFLRALGVTSLDVGSDATAAVPPVDLVLVLDQSGSLAANNAFDDLQDASKEFVEHFDDELDQLGLVSFQLRSTDRFTIAHDFTNSIKSEINLMSSAGDTNAGEGLRAALLQMQSPAVRERSAKVVVFFTDGRPTAFRGQLGPGGPVGGGSSLGPFTSGGRVRRPDDGRLHLDHGRRAWVLKRPRQPADRRGGNGERLQEYLQLLGVGRVGGQGQGQGRGSRGRECDSGQRDLPIRRWSG